MHSQSFYKTIRHTKITFCHLFQLCTVKVTTETQPQRTHAIHPKSQNKTFLLRLVSMAAPSDNSTLCRMRFASVNKPIKTTVNSVPFFLTPPTTTKAAAKQHNRERNETDNYNITLTGRMQKILSNYFYSQVGSYEGTLPGSICRSAAKKTTNKSQLASREFTTETRK